MKRIKILFTWGDVIELRSKTLVVTDTAMSLDDREIPVELIRGYTVHPVN